MPELPEVETIRLGLQKYLVGHIIESVDVRSANLLTGETSLIIGAAVTKVRRYGKGLVIDLSNGYSLAIHVKMTGQLIYRSSASDVGPVVPHPIPMSSVADAPSGHSNGGPSHATHSLSVKSLNRSDFAGRDLPDKYTHVIFHLDRDAVLFYRDIRRFGWLYILKTSEVGDMAFFKSLGLEPLRDLKESDFVTLTRKYKGPVKSLLMDQTKIAGVGNIYANDALYDARIHPLRSAAALSDGEAGRLFHSLELLLTKSIAVGGASANNYVNALGEKGSYQDHFLVYKKDGMKCLRCSTTIVRIKVAGRGTFFCPDCQKS